jgi:hypothetical protein
MHNNTWLVPVLIVAIVMASHAFRTWVRAKHGYPLEDENGRRLRRDRNHGAGDIEAERKIMLLSNENERLTGQVSRLEDRIAVLERIATDPAERTAREIDALR